MNQIEIKRPSRLSIIYEISEPAYQHVMQLSSNYVYSGMGLFNDLASNIIISDCKLGTVSSILNAMGAVQTTDFVTVYELILDKPLGNLDTITRRDWPKVYNDLVEAGLKNRAKNGENAIDWVLDGVIINKEGVEAPEL